MICPFAQDSGKLPHLVSVESRKGQHGKTWASPNTLARILARVLHTEAARMARCPLLARVLHAETTRTAHCRSARPKTAKIKNSYANHAHKSPCPRRDGFMDTLGCSKIWQSRTAAVSDNGYDFR